MSDQAREMAHLRELPRCTKCGAPATRALFNGMNGCIAVYCSKHSHAALAEFKAGK